MTEEYRKVREVYKKLMGIRGPTDAELEMINQLAFYLKGYNNFSETLYQKLKEEFLEVAKYYKKGNEDKLKQNSEAKNERAQ